MDVFFLLTGTSKGIWPIKLGNKTPYFKGQLVNPGLPGKMTIIMVFVCIDVCMCMYECVHARVCFGH